MTLLYSVLSVYPIIDVKSPMTFAIKIVSVLAGANLVGIVIYLLAGKRKRR